MEERLDLKPMVRGEERSCWKVGWVEIFEPE
jgi:hypothetical protein